MQSEPGDFVIFILLNAFWNIEIAEILNQLAEFHKIWYTSFAEGYLSLLIVIPYTW
jgi:hypothetical protein